MNFSTKMPRSGPSCRRRARVPAGVIASWAMVWVMAWAVPASAQSQYSLHATGNVVGAWTDNINGASADAGPDEVQVESSFFTQIRPAGLFTFESRRSVHVVSYTLDISLAEAETTPTTINHSANWNGLFQTSPLTELGLGANVGLGTVNAVLAAGNPAAGIDAQPQGASTFVSTAANQSFRWQFARDWRFNQGASASRVTTDLEDQNGNGSSTEALTAGASVGIDRSWVRSALGLAFDTSYVDLGTPVLDPDTNMFVTLNQTQLNSAVTAQYRRDISRRWAASARLGVGVVTALEGAEFAAVVTPVGGATVNYFRQFGLVTGNFGLGVTRAVAPNLFVATNTTSNAAALTAGIPLPWFRRGPEFTVQVAGSAGASMFETVTLDINDPQSRWLLFNADAAVIWSARPGLDVALRYQFVHQNGDEVDLPTQVADFTRNTVLITVGVRYPTRQAAVMPDRTPLRVDRADETPIGDEGQSTGEAPARR